MMRDAKVIHRPFLPGQSGNPRGRPKGSRHKLSEAFLADLAALARKADTRADMPEVGVVPGKETRTAEKRRAFVAINDRLGCSMPVAGQSIASIAVRLTCERRQRDAEFAGAGTNRLLDAADWMMTAASSGSRNPRARRSCAATRTRFT
jgi:hypothetical protein